MVFSWEVTTGTGAAERLVVSSWPKDQPQIIVRLQKLTEASDNILVPGCFFSKQIKATGRNELSEKKAGGEGNPAEPIQTPSWAEQRHANEIQQ